MRERDVDVVVGSAFGAVLADEARHRRHGWVVTTMRWGSLTDTLRWARRSDEAVASLARCGTPVAHRHRERGCRG